MSYPTCCTSQFCGMLLCDGCVNKPVLVKFYERKGATDAAAFEARQDKLRADKAAKRGAFSYLADQEVAS